MCTERHAPLATQRGLTLVELIFFIVVVSFGLAGILLVLNQSTSRSADPMVRKQLLAIAADHQLAVDLGEGVQIAEHAGSRVLGAVGIADRADIHTQQF